MTQHDCDFPKLLAAAVVGVVRELTYDEERALWERSCIGDVSDVAGVLLADGRALLCASDQHFYGSEVTDPDPYEVKFRIIPADVVSEKLSAIPVE